MCIRDSTISPDVWNEFTPPPPAPLSYDWAIADFDNDAQWVVAQNASDNTWGPDLWTRFDWTTDADGTLYFCMATYTAETKADAMAADESDTSNPAETGCRGSSMWTPLFPVG